MIVVGWGDGAQLWAGERGFLFWSAKLAFGAIFVLVGWVLIKSEHVSC